jgi:hypothetical protein
MGKRLAIACLAGLSFASLPRPTAAAPYQVEIKNETPYCLSVQGVAVPGVDAAKGVFLHFPGPPKTNLQAGKTIVATYDLPRPAKTIEVQGGPCTPTTPVPRKFAHATQAGRDRNVFRILPAPNQTILVK